MLFLLFSSMMLACSSADDDAPKASPGQQIEAYLSTSGLSNEVTTSTGLVYIINDPGGAERPTIADEITIIYKGTLTNGTQFDATRGPSSSFPLNRLIQGWQEGIPLIGRGGSIILMVPPALGYGNNPPAGTGITSNSVLVFDIQLLDF